MQAQQSLAVLEIPYANKRREPKLCSHLPSLIMNVTALMCIAGHHSLPRERQFRTFSVSYLFIYLASYLD